MILAVDVGNTNITCGVFKGEEIVASFRITTKMPRTSDEYGMMLGTLLEKNQVNEKEIRDAIIASVVPNVMHSLQNAIIKYLGITPIVVELICCHCIYNSVCPYLLWVWCCHTNSGLYSCLNYYRCYIEIFDKCTLERMHYVWNY